MKRLSIMLLALTLSGCAVQHSQAPQITAQTTLQLNLASQVQQANKDYATFFTDVGNAQRAGQMTAADVILLNVAGDKLKGLLEKANALERTYAQNSDATLPAQISALVVEAAQIYASMYGQRATMLARKVN